MATGVPGAADGAFGAAQLAAQQIDPEIRLELTG
jgi:hypothetical protein